MPLKQRRQRHAHSEVNRVALKSAVGIELGVAAQVGVDRHATQVEIVADLRAEPARARLEGSGNWELPFISRQLLIVISHGADEELLCQELRSPEIQMRVNSIRVVGRRVLEILGEAQR